MQNTRYIRFDWAIKRLLRHKADFVVVEGFLSSLLGRPVEILDVLESEGNQEAADDKYNRVDMLVRDGDGSKVIIEIQNNYEADFFHRMLYGASKAVTQYIKITNRFGVIGKVYSVNIVYFSLGVGRDYVYHGTTEFRGIHWNDVLALDERQRGAFGGVVPADIFPEYFILRVEDFDSVAKTPLDEWIYFLKTEQIPEGAAAPGLREARAALSEALMTDRERAAYEQHYNNLRVANAEIWSADLKGRMEGRAEGRAEGLAEGEAKLQAEREARVLRLASKGMPASDIAEIMDMPLPETLAILQKRAGLA